MHRSIALLFFLSSMLAYPLGSNANTKEITINMSMADVPKQQTAAIAPSTPPSATQGTLSDSLTTSFNKIIKAGNTQPPQDFAPIFPSSKSVLSQDLNTLGQLETGLKSMLTPEEALLPFGTMSPLDQDGFPPFFGDQTPQNTSTQSLLGTYSTTNFTLTLAPQNHFVIVVQQQQGSGTWSVQGDQLFLHFQNGKVLTIQFRQDKDALVLANGQRLVRQTTNQSIVSSPQGIDGTWIASDGTNMVIFMFRQGVCAINMNGQQLSGPYQIQGNQIAIQFSNGQTLNLEFRLEGNTLRFSDGTVLARQSQPIIQQPQPPQNPVATPLEGKWGTTLPNGVHITFIFQGQNYTVLTNNQPTEAGTFTLLGNKLQYTTTQGPAAGQKGENTWQLQNNTQLILTLPNGSGIFLTRE